MNSKFLIWLRKNTWMTFIFSSIMGGLYFILCLFLGYLIHVYLYDKYTFVLYGIILMFLFQIPLLTGINHIDRKYKISKPYQDSK